jgi:FkbM family methyltransferase
MSLSSNNWNNAANNHHPSSHAIIKTMFENANRKIAERRAWLSSAHSEGGQFGQLNGAQMWYMFTPVLPCFWTFEKEPSCTQVHDGGKWLCGLKEVHESRKRNHDDSFYGVNKHHYQDKPCIVYSIGSNNEFSFEEKVRVVAPGCEIHTFDPTVKETGEGTRFYDQYHDAYGLGGIDSNRGRFPVRSIESIMKELNHDHVDYLKVDVEGFEWDFLRQVDWNKVRVGQLLIEMHPPVKDGPSFHVKGDMNAHELDLIFHKLEEAGFYLISLEPVTYSNFGQVELVFLHKDWRPEGMIYNYFS